MEATESTFRILSEQDVAHAVVRTRMLCSAMGFETSRAQMVATAVSELARNIIKYTSGGTVTVRSVNMDNAQAVEVVANDQGPGIGDIEKALQDHYSQGGTLGLGLPGVKRLMDEFDIASQPGNGTTVTVRKRL